MRIAALLLALATLCPGERHYIYFNRERERISEQAFLRAAAIEGAQLKYAWRELEPRKGVYDFSAVRKDLEFLRGHGKRLFVQLQDVSFSASIVNVPRYLLEEKEYAGGVAPQRGGGLTARRWDPAVRGRFHLLLAAMGRELDGRIEGVNLPETSIEVTGGGRKAPDGFTYERYRDAVIANMEALRRAFPKSVAMQYANFMPGEWLPGDDKSYLRSVYRAARELGVGVGGPDLLPTRPAQRAHAYPLIRQSAGAVPTGIAVQSGNYAQRDPKTGRRLTISELRRFAVEDLRVDYIFWEAQAPYYERDLLPWLAGSR